MITTVFWTLFAIEAAGFLVLLAFFFRAMHAGREGPVGPIVLMVPPVVLLSVAAAVLLTKSDTTKLVSVLVLGLPLVPLVVGPLYSLLARRQVERELASDHESKKEPL